jgi:hypothetical protein
MSLKERRASTKSGRGSMGSTDGYGGVRARMAEVTREKAEMVARLNHMHDILEFTSDAKTRKLRKAEWMTERNRSVARLRKVPNHRPRVQTPLVDTLTLAEGTWDEKKLTRAFSSQMVAALTEMLDEEADAPPVETPVKASNEDGGSARHSLSDEASNALTEVASADNVTRSSSQPLRTASSIFYYIPETSPTSCVLRLQTDLFLTFMDGLTDGSIRVAQPERHLFRRHTSPDFLEAPPQESRPTRESVPLLKRVDSLRKFIPDKIARLPRDIRSLSSSMQRWVLPVRYDNGAAAYDLAI